ncbi:hypothetical protein FPV16_20100 [Methylobacterium sp. W2]|uniref:hypothetical protein n=1 Tax=Methylobacterium sp. W2 TaxID=2598107 RepID=UPI001D0BFAF2|nr:hypothetical protein [Methylobacterium sp. W2]MCC0808487.1 hypothetical protein [Methylobacterium sp. W2]
MTTRSNVNAISFDPYGEPLGEDRTPLMVQGDWRARNAAIVVFWTLALTLITVRIYFSDHPLGQTLALAQAQIESFVTAIR